MDSYRVSVLAKWNAIQRVDLSGRVTTSGIAVDFQSYEIILKKGKQGKKNLADQLRACVVVARGVALSGAAVATAADGLKHSTG